MIKLFLNVCTVALISLWTVSSAIALEEDIHIDRDDAVETLESSDINIPYYNAMKRSNDHCTLATTADRIVQSISEAIDSAKTQESILLFLDGKTVFVVFSPDSQRSLENMKIRWEIKLRDHSRRCAAGN